MTKYQKEMKEIGALIGKLNLFRGAAFSTASEDNCMVVTLPDEVGNFDAYDSDNVICSFNVNMITEVYPQELSDGKSSYVVGKKIIAPK